MIEAGALLWFLIWIIVLGIIFYLLLWMIGQIGLPAPFDKVARVVLALAAVLILINLLMGVVGTPLFR